MDGVARFTCAECGKPAGVLTIGDRDGEPWLRRKTFTGMHEIELAPEAARRLEAAVDAADARAIYDVDIEFVPFYCPTCPASYCGEHWMTWDLIEDDGWYDSMQGRCPRGHERTLED